MATSNYWLKQEHIHYELEDSHKISYCTDSIIPFSLIPYIAWIQESEQRLSSKRYQRLRRYKLECHTIIKNTDLLNNKKNLLLKNIFE